MDKIQFKRSINSGFKPAVNQLSEGELIINLPDKKIFTKDDKGQVISIGGSLSPNDVFVKSQSDRRYLRTDMDTYTQKGLTVMGKLMAPSSATFGKVTANSLDVYRSLTVGGKKVGGGKAFYCGHLNAPIGWKNGVQETRQGFYQFAPKPAIAMRDMEHVGGSVKVLSDGYYKVRASVLFNVTGCQIYFNAQNNDPKTHSYTNSGGMIDMVCEEIVYCSSGTLLNPQVNVSTQGKVAVFVDSHTYYSITEI